MLAVACALGSALLYALASVLQQRGAAAEPAEEALRLRLLARLARNPGWVLGVACDLLGYVLQFIALDRGTLVVVQPLLVCGLLFALPMGARWAGRRLRPRDWAASVAVCAGLSAFLVVADPSRGSADVGARLWVALLVSGALATFALVAASVGRQDWQRAVLLSGAAGITYGIAAALTKTTGADLSRGLGSLVTQWQPYALLVVAVVGMVLAQSAFQAGSLDASLPTMTVADPVVSIVIGALAFGETIGAGATSVVVEVAALAVMAAGVFALAQSEAIRSVHQPRPVRAG